MKEGVGFDSVVCGVRAARAPGLATPRPRGLPWRQTPLAPAQHQMRRGRRPICKVDTLCRPPLVNQNLHLRMTPSQDNSSLFGLRTMTVHYFVPMPFAEVLDLFLDLVVSEERRFVRVWMSPWWESWLCGTTRTAPISQSHSPCSTASWPSDQIHARCLPLTQ
jgi:hypothetical protein